MSIKLIAPLTLLAAGLLVAACGEETEADVGSTGGAAPVVEYVEAWGGYPLSADGAIRYELGKREAERAERARVLEEWGSYPLTADGAIRRELAKLEAERADEPADSWGGYPVTADGAIRRELAKLEAERAQD